MRARARGLLLCLLAVAGCRIDSVSLLGKACPCPLELDCDPASSTCVPRGSLDFATPPDLVVPLSPDATLGTLLASAGTFSPAFTPTTTTYLLEVPLEQHTVTLMATPASAHATLTIDGVETPAGTATPPLSADGSPAAVSLRVQAESGATAAYTVVIVRDHYLKPSVVSAASFGSSVAIDGDTLAVGAPRDPSCATGIDADHADTGCPQAGSVTLFARSDGTWVQAAYVKPSFVEPGSAFGTAVALSGDTLAVGARSDSSCGAGVGADPSTGTCPASGAAWIFTRTGTTWSQQAYIKPSNPASMNSFGNAIALVDDSLAVAASGDPSCATGIDGDASSTSCGAAGAVFLYSRFQGSWAQRAYIKPSASAPLGLFGTAIALSADTLAVGEIGDDACAVGVNGTSTGAFCTHDGGVYVFAIATSTVTQVAYLKPFTVPDPYNDFGAALALSGDTLVVGAPGESGCASGVNGDQTMTGCDSAGAAFVFTRTAGAWTTDAYIKAAHVGSGDGLGNAVALSDDTLLVGASHDATDAPGIDDVSTTYDRPGSGAAILFERGSGTWRQTDFIKAQVLDSNDQLGFALALSTKWALIGAVNDESNASGVDGAQTNNDVAAAGAAHAYSR